MENFSESFLNSLYFSALLYSDVVYGVARTFSFEQSGLISIVVGAGAAWFGLYAGTSGSSKSFKGEGKE
jgi:uncharacterized membrane protein